MLHVEYPHEVIVQEKVKVPDGGGGHIEQWISVKGFYGFMDTPSSREVYQAHKLENTLDRNLYVPYRKDLHAKMRIKHDEDTYELAGKPQDQGGQREVLVVPLKLVPHG
jgi:SPP1 family predicted phage head-tail adaptor